MLVGKAVLLPLSLSTVTPTRITNLPTGSKAWSQHRASRIMTPELRPHPF